MPKTILEYVFRHSPRQQVIVLIGTMAYMPLLYVTFELPKIILNQAIGGKPGDFPMRVAGFSLDQLSFLLVLCVALFVLVLIAGATRYTMRAYKGIIGEMLLRKLRLDLYNQILRFPPARLRRITGGEIIAMSTSEVEPIGKYMGIAVANPTLHGGTLVTAMVFLFAQDVILGIAAIALFPVQAWVIPVLQRKINAASRVRIEHTRRFAAHVSETMQGLKEIRANHTAAFERANLLERLGGIFARGREVYSRSSVLIFVNHFFNHLTPFLFYSIGGVLVLKGSLTIGALVAVIAAYRETAAPWNELLENYQQLQENEIKYQALIENFDLEDEAPSPGAPQVPADGPVELRGVGVTEDGVRRLDGIDAVIAPGALVAFTGAADSGKSELAEVMAGLRRPDAGCMLIGGADGARMSADGLGRAVAYADAQSFVFTGTWRDALVYGLKRPPETGGAGAPETGGEWLDLARAGVADTAALEREICRVLDVAGLTDDVRTLGLRRGVRADMVAALSDKLLHARRIFRASLAGEPWAEGIEFFDRERFIENATVAENLLFGRPLDDSLGVYRLGGDAEVMAIVERNGLCAPLIEAGRAATRTIVDLFAAVAADDDRLQQFSLIRAEEMHEYQAILARHGDTDAGEIKGDDRRRLLAVAFQLAPAHQRLGLIDDALRARILAARHDFLANAAPGMAGRLDPFGPDHVTVDITVQCNLLYGRIDKRDARHWPAIRTAMGAALDAAGLGEGIIALGLGASVGTGGSLLVAEQRQRIAFARGLLKRPRLMVLHEALGALDDGEQAALLRRFAAFEPRPAVAWIGRVPAATKALFGAVYELRAGRIEADAGARAAAEGDGLAAEAHMLAAIPALAGVRAETLRLMAFAAERRRFSGGDVLIREGDRSADVFVVVAGTAVASVAGSRVGEAGAGSVLGEVAAIAGLPRTATVTASGPVEALVLGREVFLDLVRADDGLSQALLRDLAGRVVALTDRLGAGRGTGSNPTATVTTTYP